MNISTTEWTKLTEDMYGDLEFSYWLADRNGSVDFGLYVWQQGRHPHRFDINGSYYIASDFTHIMRMAVPKHPSKEIT